MRDLGARLFASTLTENQFVALILTYAMTVGLYMVEFLIGATGSVLLNDVLTGVSVTYGLRWAALGLLDSHWVVLTLVYVFVFLHILVLVYGGYWTYANTPLGNWAKDAFGLARNRNAWSWIIYNSVRPAKKGIL